MDPRVRRRVRGAATTGASGPRWAARHELALYFVLAFILSWAIWPLTLLNPDSSPLIPFGPALAAIFVTLLAHGPKAVMQLLRQLTRWRAHPGWYLTALLLPCLFLAVGAAVAIALGAPGFGAPEAGPTEAGADGDGGAAVVSAVVALAGSFVSTLVIVGLFEELGWRGFALPRLQEAHTALWSALVLGLVWAAWHLPELVSDPTGQRSPIPFMVTLISQSVIMTWLYNSTGGGLPVVMVFHAAFNTVGAVVFQGFFGPYYLTLWWAVAVLHVVAAVLVAVSAGPARLIRGGGGFHARS